MSNWLNNKKTIEENLKLGKPCHDLEYCPYGKLIEEFPLRPENRKKKLKNIECNTFGHDCPVYYMAENITE